MIHFGFDTETTGLADFRKPSNDPSQPDIIQMAGILYCDHQGVLSSFNFLIDTDKEISPEASVIHGITREKLDLFSISKDAALSIFTKMAQKAEIMFGHNIPFDLKMVRIMAEKAGKRYIYDDHIEPVQKFCTMLNSTQLVNLPPTQKMIDKGMNKPKAPKLEEAYLHFFGEEMVNAHDAMADLMGCMRVYKHLRTMM